MVEAEVQVFNELGLHARAGARLVKLANTFDCSISLIRGDNGVVANAKSMLDVMFLAAERGTRVKITADGNGEQQAIDELSLLFANGFGEK